MVKTVGTAVPEKCRAIDLYNVLKVKYFHHENFYTPVLNMGVSCTPSYTSI